MDRDTEIRLLDEILGLRKAGSAFLDEDVTQSPVSRYTDTDRFAREQTALFRQRPVALAHVSELASDGDFLVRSLAGRPILLTRDREGEVHAFLNVCRHRGMELVPAETGCRHRFTCPYHAWTWDNRGNLIAVPHREQGFPDQEADAYALHRVAVEQRHGWIWVQIEGHMDLGQLVAPLADDFAWLDMDQLEVHAVDARDWACNWKILAEGGLEAYHFRVAHADTIAALFHDNLSTYECLGSHIRSVLARRSVDELVEMPRDDWHIRQHTNLLYTLMAGTIFLVQADHVVWLQVLPLSVDRTHVRLATLRPAGELTDKAQTYWDRNHALTVETLNEDFVIGEKIQAGFAMGANESLTFGRYEGALARFNEMVESALSEESVRMQAAE